MAVKIIKVIEEEQLKNCLAIRDTVFIKEKKVSKDIEIDEFDILSPYCIHFLVEVDEKFIGTFRLVLEDNNVIHLGRLCFLKEYRGKGLGKESLSFVEAYAKAHNQKQITLHAKFAAKGFYEKSGFVISSYPFIEADVLHVLMIKEI